MGEQFVLKSQKAFDAIHFDTCISADNTEYYAKRKARDNQARAAFRLEVEKEDIDDAMRNLGEAMDYVVNQCHLNMGFFMDMFIASGLARQFGLGVPKLVSGMSGTELVWEVIGKSGIIELPEAQIEYEYSSEYWCGWILAYYQWYTGRDFKNIKKNISMKDIDKLYPTLHEASEEKFVDTVNCIIQRKKLPTRLQMLRRMVGYSQRILSEKSGVKLRNIQQYEQRSKNINKAAATTLVALAQTIGCSVEDLLEYDNDEIE